METRFLNSNCVVLGEEKEKCSNGPVQAVFIFVCVCGVGLSTQAAGEGTGFRF